MWDHKRAAQAIARYTEGATIVLPFAAIIETGNFIGHQRHYTSAKSLAHLIIQCVDEQSPWAAFEDQGKLWDREALRKLASTWPEQAKSGLQIGDLTIRKIVDYYHQAGQRCEIRSGDADVKAYESPKPALVPRRRKK